MRSILIAASLVATIAIAGCSLTPSSPQPVSPAPSPGPSERPFGVVRVAGIEARFPMRLQVFDRSGSLIDVRSATARELAEAEWPVGRNAVGAAQFADGSGILVLCVGLTCDEGGDLFVESGGPRVVIAPSVPAACDTMPNLRGIVLRFDPAADLEKIDFDLRPAVVGEELTDAETFLFAGIRQDARVDCQPKRSGLPALAIAGVECASDSELVARSEFFLFESKEDLLSTYLEGMAKQGITTNSGGCGEGEGESNYVPGDIDALVPYRDGCYIDGAGVANHRATYPDGLVYVGAIGTTPALAALRDWVWRGNQ
jgi:hypothetical protein